MKSWCNGISQTRVLIAPARTSNATGGSQGCTKGSFLSLHHPKSGSPTSYFFQGCSLYELNWYKQSFGSWFLGNYVSEDGSMYFATPVDPVFILLPVFEAARMKSEKDRGMFRELNEIFYVDGFPAYQHLLPIAEASMRSLCEMKEIGTSRFFRLDDSKVFSWLCLKASSLKITLSKLDRNYAAREEKETLIDVVSLLGEYLKDDPWMKLLCGHFQLDLQDARRIPPADTFLNDVDSPEPPSRPQAKKSSNGRSSASTGKQSKKPKTQVDSKNIKDMFRRATRSGGT